MAKKESPRSPGSHPSLSGRQEGHHGKAEREGHSTADLGSWDNEGDQDRSKGQGTGSAPIGITQPPPLGKSVIKK